MPTRYLARHKIDILILTLLIIIVGLLHIILLEPHLHYGFTPDDWWPLKNYKYLDGNFLSNSLEIWKQSGVYLTYQVLFVGIMHNFFGFNFEAYQITNHILKALSALAVYPLMLIVFKSRFLAFVTVILYAMAYSPVGTLELVVRGSDFIAIIFLCIFLIAYYKTIIKKINNVKWLVILTILLLLTVFFSPIRIYPVLFFIMGVEIYLFIGERSMDSLKNSIRRMAFIFAPFFLVTLLSPSSVISFTVNAPAIINRIIAGNWQLLLYPLGSLGSLFFLNDYWKIFGIINIISFTEYINYILFNPLITFMMITLFFSIILSIPAKRFLNFFLKVLITNSIFQLLIFILAKHAESLSSNIRMSYDYVELYPVFFATYILILSYFIFREWVDRARKDIVLLALWIGPMFSFIYIFWTWLFKDWSVLFKGVHTYLNIPSIGVSLFVGATFVLFYQKIRDGLGIPGKYIAPLIFLLLIPIFSINKNTIFHTWNLNNYSMDAKEHEAMRTRFLKGLSNFDNKKPTLFYFDTLVDYPNGRFYEESMTGRFSDWMYFKGNFAPKSCAIPAFIVNNLDQLKSVRETRDDKNGFNYYDHCSKSYFYPMENFYAFRLNNKQAVNIKDEILKQLDVESP